MEANSCAAFCDSCARDNVPSAAFATPPMLTEISPAAAGRFVGVASHFIGGGALLFDRGGDGRGNVVDLINDAAHRPDRRHRALGVQPEWR